MDSFWSWSFCGDRERASVTPRSRVGVGVSRPTVIGWRERYLEGGTAALDDRPRPGRAKQIDEAEVVVATLEAPPERLGAPHWSARLLAGELGLGHATIARVWAKWNLQPWRVETFKFCECRCGAPAGRTT